MARVPVPHAVGAVRAAVAERPLGSGAAIIAIPVKVVAARIGATVGRVGIGTAHGVMGAGATVVTCTEAGHRSVGSTVYPPPARV